MAVRIFVSYSHRDQRYLAQDNLLGFLRGLENDGSIQFWIDESLRTGDRWDDEIRSQINRADIVLVLVSQAFLDSTYCMDVEIAGFLERRRNDGLIVFPVVLSPCEWSEHGWLASTQFIPSQGQTIEEHYIDEGMRKGLFLKIRKELRALSRQAAERKSLQQPPGAASKPSVQRRTVTLVCCSIRATALNSELDEDDLAELLYEAREAFQERCRIEIEAVQGSVLGESLPQGVLGCLGIPLAHEDDAVRAIRAGISICRAIAELGNVVGQKWGARLDASIGIHSGSVIWSLEQSQSKIAGETLTICQALRNLAPRGMLLISAATLSRVRGFFEVEELGAFNLPEIERSIQGYRVIKDHGFNSRFEAKREAGLLRLVGRTRELDLILDRFSSVLRGRGQLVLVTAEAGIGKSRLIEDFRLRIAGEGIRLVNSQCSPYHQNTSLYPLIKPLSELLELDEQTDDVGKIDKLEATIASLGGEIETLAPLLANLLSIPVDGLYAELEASPRQQKEMLFELALAILLELARKRPLVLICEDLHWMDPSSLELLGLLISQIGDLPIFVVCSARPEFSVPAQWGGSSVLQLALDRLDRAEVGQMIADIAGGKSLPAEIEHEIYLKTEGYPLFVEDLTRMVLESGQLEERDGRYLCSAGFHTLRIPETLTEVLKTRLGDLEGALFVAQIGAIIGREFTLKVHSAISRLEEATLQQELGRLMAKGLIYRRGMLSSATYTFKHALIQEALYDSLLKRERRQYHELIAKLLENIPAVREGQPELLARHFSRGGDTRRALEFWLLAGEKGCGRSAYLEALNHAGHALELLGELPENERVIFERRILSIKGPALLALKGWGSPEIGEVYRRFHEICGDAAHERFRASRGLWGWLMVSGRLAESVELAYRLEALAGDSVDYLIEVQVAFCDSLFWLGRPEESLKYARRGLELYDLDRHHGPHSNEYGEDPSVVFLCYAGISSLLLGRPSRSAESVRLLKLNIERYTHHFSRAFAVNGVAWAARHRGDVKETMEYGTLLLELARKHDFPPWLAIAKTQIGWARGISGEIDEGVAEIAGAVDDWQAAGGQVSTALAYLSIVEIYQEAGRTREAIEWADRGLANLSIHEERHAYAELFRHRARLELAISGDPLRAAELFGQALRHARSGGAIFYELRTLLSMATCGCRTDEGIEEIALLLEKFEPGCGFPEIAAARALIGEFACQTC